MTDIAPHMTAYPRQRLPVEQAASQLRASANRLLKQIRTVFACDPGAHNGFIL
jgi:hypothetical protein